MKSVIQPFASLCLLSLFAVACGGSKEGGGSSETESVKVLPEIQAIFADSAPDGALSVAEARKSAKAGETVTVSGKIAGAISPFTESFATLVLADTALETCDLNPADSCTTPWDACCVDSDTIKSLRLTIQVVGDDDRPLPQSLEGVEGIKELDPIVVTGTVAAGSTKENMILNVSSLFKQK